MNNPSNQSNSSTGSLEAQASACPVCWIGLDWADQEHCLAVRSNASAPPQLHRIKQTPEDLDAFFLQLHAQHPHGRIAVAIEQSRGPVLYALLKFDFLLIYPVNPRCLSDYRAAFKMSHAKDDPSDAGLLCELAFLHADRLRPLVCEDEVTRKLRLLCEARRNFVQDRTAYSNRLGATLKCFYPLALEVSGDDLTSIMALDFLCRWPNYKSLKAAQTKTLRAFFYAHNSRSEECIARRLESIAKSKPLTEDPALVEPLQFQMQQLVQALRTVQRTIDQYDKQIKQLFSLHSEAYLFGDLPGAAAVMAPRLAAVFGTQRSNFPSAQELLCMTGVAPVQKKSGLSEVVQFRYARSIFVHQSIVEFAKCSLAKCKWAKMVYEDQRSKGKSRWAAIRVVAFKWLRILWRCWQDRKPYEEQRYLRSLQKHGVKLFEPLYSQLGTI